MMGKNQSVGKGNTKWLGGPCCGQRAACCAPLVYTILQSLCYSGALLFAYNCSRL